VAKRRPHRREHDLRGNSRDRRRRREFLIETFGIPRPSDGKKTKIRCYHCKRLMMAQGSSWDVDRFPICGHDGGRYVRSNIVPSCTTCNKGRCYRCRAI
jgi:hypothetical protein